MAGSNLNHTRLKFIKTNPQWQKASLLPFFIILDGIILGDGLLVLGEAPKYMDMPSSLKVPQWSF